MSPLGWKSAIFELSALESNLTPSMMLNALARAAKAIYSEFKLAVIPSMKDSSNAYLGADDFVPVFIYVFCQSDLKHSLLNKDLMWNLCHPDQLHGECGYYLTAYESSIEYIMNETPTPEELLEINEAMNTMNVKFESRLRLISSDSNQTGGSERGTEAKHNNERWRVMFN